MILARPMGPRGTSCELVVVSEAEKARLLGVVIRASILARGDIIRLVSRAVRCQWRGGYPKGVSDL